MRLYNSIIIMATAACALASCDDGSITDPVYTDDSRKFTARMTATLHGLDQWNESCSVALAAFDETSRYSVIQKNLLPKADTRQEESVILSSIPGTATSVELVVVDNLRRRMATIASAEIPDGYDERDTVLLNLGAVDASPFGVVSACVFNGSSLSCARCHQGEKAAAGLDLSAGVAYGATVGVESRKSEGSVLIVPGNSGESFLYKVITEGDESVQYSHTGLFVEDDVAPLVEIVKMWIDEGANR